MNKITNYINTIPVIEKAFAHLKEKYDINAYITDNIDNPSVQTITENHVIKSYPLEYGENSAVIHFISPVIDTLNMAEEEITILVDSINEILQREIEINQMSSEIMELSEQINFLFNFATQTGGVKTTHNYCTITIEQVSKKILADWGIITVRGHDDDVIMALFGISDENKAINVMTEDAFKIASEKNEPVISTITDKSSAIVCPIITKSGQIGSMGFFRNPGSRQFTAYEKKFMGIINKNISETLEILMLYEGLKKVYLNTVKALGAAIDAKDPYTHGHSYRVAKYSVAIAKELNLSDDELSNLEIAAYMHDIGKIGISEMVLRKTGKLTDGEYNEIKKHPSFTQKILKPARLPESIVKTAAYHHERVDGKGYPFGLTRNEIPLSAQIVGVADVFDALTSDRPYRAAMPVEKALEIIISDTGKAFDKEVVIALIKTLNNNMAETDSIYPELKFSDINGLNTFLDNLTERLIEK